MGNKQREDSNCIKCPRCNELEELTSAMEDLIGRTNAQLLSAEMLDMELEQIFSACADPMIVIRTDNIIVRANKQMQLLLNKTNDELVGKNVATILTEQECALATANLIAQQEDIMLATNTGEPRNFIITATRLITIDGTPGTLIQYKDITERKRAEQSLAQAHAALQKIAQIDGLTQIANRRTFDETLHRQWLKHSENKQPLAAILSDIDFFKKYNDTYGHQQGDSCLISVAHALAGTISEDDGLVARYGGEEFIFLLPNTTISTASKIAHRARCAVENLAIDHATSTVAAHVTLSLGVSACVPSNNSTAKELIEAADIALYAAKESGRNRVVCAPQTTNATSAN